MKTILLSVFAITMFAAPALAEDATNDPFGGRMPFFQTLQTGAASGGVDLTATAAIPTDLTGGVIAGEKAEIVFNRYNR